MQVWSSGYRIAFGGVFAAVLQIVFASSVDAKVVDISENGFQLKMSVPVKASCDSVYRNLTQHVGKWWDSSHTWSGDSRNLAIDPKPQGGLLERLPHKGFVRHFGIVAVQPGKLIRFQGGMGPLQEHAVNGVMTIQFQPDAKNETACTIQVTYNVGGYIPGGKTTLEEWAPPVDRVIHEQIVRLKNFSEGKPLASETDSK